MSGTDGSSISLASIFFSSNCCTMHDVVTGKAMSLLSCSPHSEIGKLFIVVVPT